MTTDFHLLGDTDDRLVTRAREYTFDIREGDGIPSHSSTVADFIEQLIERVYQLHERTEELDRERENADNMQVELDALGEAVKDGADALHDWMAENESTDKGLAKIVADLRWYL